MKRAVSIVLTWLLLVGAFFFILNVKVIHAQAEVYIKSDGSVSPSYAPISTLDNVSYILTGNISYPAYDGITVQRSNVVIDGNGYTVQANQNSTGLYVSYVSNVTIKNTNVRSGGWGIYLYQANNSTLSGNNVTATYYGGISMDYSSYDNINGNNVTASTGAYGIEFQYDSHSSINGNNITNNGNGILLTQSSASINGNNIMANTNYGISLSSSGNSSITGNNFKNNGHGIGMDSSSSNNDIYRNNFVGNTVQAASSPAINVWDNGYPFGGNYWSNYDGTDLHSGPSQNLNGSDGIGDTSYIIDANNTDHYPIMNPYAASPDMNVTLNFPVGTNLTSLNITEYTSTSSPYLPLPNETGPIYNVTIHTASGLTGLVRIGIHYDPNLVINTSKLVIAQFDYPAGDINYDNKVNLQDLVLLANAYGSTLGNPKWNSSADLNGDGKVNLQDLVLLALHYGKTGAGWIDHQTTVDTTNDFAYCTTDHFSGIGIHQS